VLCGVAAYAVALSCAFYLMDGWKPHRVETAWIIFGFAVIVGLALRIDARGPSGVDAAPGVSRHARVLLAAVLGCTVLVYGPALNVGWLSDDFVLMDLPPGATGWQHGGSTVFRPLPIALFQFTDRVFAAHAATMLHALSVMLHLLNGSLVWSIARRFGASPSAALAGIALFLLFPASVEAVAWCSGLQDVLATTASLGLIRLALGSAPVLPMLVCLLAGVSSKETAVVAPFVALALRVARDRRVPRPHVLALGLTCAAAVAFAIWRLQAGDLAPTTMPSRYVIKNIVSNALVTLALPFSSDSAGRMALTGVFMAVMTATAGIGAVGAPAERREAALALGLLVWILAAIAPVHSLFFVSGALEGSRFLYLATPAWALLLSVASASAPAHLRVALRIGLLLLLALWTAAGFRHVRVWTQAAAERDRILSAAEIVEHACDGPRFSGATDNVGGAYVFRNGFVEALDRRGIRHDGWDEPGCEYVWNGRTFEPVGRGEAPAP
jgi:hypothetical protein